MKDEELSEISQIQLKAMKRFKLIGKEHVREMRRLYGAKVSLKKK